MRYRTYLGVAAAFIFMVAALAATAPPAQAADISGIELLTATVRDAGVATDHFFDITVKGTGLTSVRFQDLTTSVFYTLTYDSGAGAWNYHDAGYASIPDVFTVHPNPGNMMFYFNESQSDFDMVIISNVGQYPTSFFDVTSPLDGSIVPENSTIDWQFTGTAQHSGTALRNLTGSTVDDVMYSPDTSPRSWSPTLQPDTDYGVVLGVWTVMTGGPLEEATLYGDYFTFIGILNDTNYVTFSTEAPPTNVPEPATMALVAAGLAGLGWMRRRRKA